MLHILWTVHCEDHDDRLCMSTLSSLLCSSGLFLTASKHHLKNNDEPSTHQQFHPGQTWLGIFSGLHSTLSSSISLPSLIASLMTSLSTNQERILTGEINQYCICVYVHTMCVSVSVCMSVCMCVCAWQLLLTILFL